MSGNYLTRRRMVLFRNLMKHLGIHPDRVHMSWVSASEGAKFAEVIAKATDAVKALGPMESLKREQAWMQNV